MLSFFRGASSSVFVWAVVGLLIVGLAGFGIGAGSFTSTNVATVGDQKISAERYARALDQELRAISQQVGRNLTIAEAQQFGVDRSVLARLVNDAALDNESATLGLSASDEMVRERLTSSPAFAGTDGVFSPETYAFALQNVGLDASEFEEALRLEAAREMIAESVQAAADMPVAASTTFLDYIGERRGVEWVRLDATLLDAPVDPPSDSDISAYYEANPDRYTRPETRRITYAILSPETLAADIDISEDDLRTLYEEAIDRYSTPERRMVDRITFGDETEAQQAKDSLDAGEVGFDALATERGLTVDDIDQGEIARSDLSSEVADQVFGAEGPGVIGPVNTALGPSLFRINAIMAGSTTPFEEAREEIAQTRALDIANDEILAESQPLDDLIAGGASIEEIVAESQMVLAEIALNSESEEALAGDPAFLELLDGAREGEETDLAALADGSLITLRLDAIEPPTVEPLEDVRDSVVSDWTDAKTAEQLTLRANEWRDEIASGLSMADLAERIGVDLETAEDVARGQPAIGLTPELVETVFASDVGDTLLETDGASVLLVRLDSITDFDPETPENLPIAESVTEEYRLQAANDVLTFFTSAVRDNAGVSVNQNMIEAAIANFR